MMGIGLGMGGFGIIFMIIFWIGLMVLAIWLVSLLFPSTRDQPGPEDAAGSASAREILNRRYARGELTTEQYREMLKTIEQ